MTSESEWLTFALSYFALENLRVAGDPSARQTDRGSRSGAGKRWQRLHTAVKGSGCWDSGSRSDNNDGNRRTTAAMHASPTRFSRIRRAVIRQGVYHARVAYSCEVTPPSASRLALRCVGFGRTSVISWSFSLERQKSHEHTSGTEF